MNAEQLEALIQRARREPLEVDVSDYSDEWVAGFLRGQANALEVLEPHDALTLVVQPCEHKLEAMRLMVEVLGLREQVLVMKAGFDAL